MYRHPTDLLSLVSGLLLGGAAVATVLDTDLPWLQARWVGPLVLILIGLALLIPMARRSEPARGALPGVPQGNETGIDGAPLSAEALEMAKEELPPTVTD